MGSTILIEANNSSDAGGTGIEIENNCFQEKSNNDDGVLTISIRGWY